MRSILLAGTALVAAALPSAASAAVTGTYVEFATSLSFGKGVFLDGVGAFASEIADGVIGLNDLNYFAFGQPYTSYNQHDISVDLQSAAGLKTFSATIANGALTALAFSFDYDFPMTFVGPNPPLLTGTVTVSLEDGIAVVVDDRTATGSASITFESITVPEIDPGMPGTGGPSPSPAPEPATWAMMVGGFGLVGAGLRRRKTTVAFA